MTLFNSLTCILYTSMHAILTFAHFSHFTHIYNNNTFSLYHFAWEFYKLFIISFTMLHFIQLKINELFYRVLEIGGYYKTFVWPYFCLCLGCQGSFTAPQHSHNTQQVKFNIKYSCWCMLIPSLISFLFPDQRLFLEADHSVLRFHLKWGKNCFTKNRKHPK